MPKNKWFDDVFLPSLFEYAQKNVGMCKNCKISDKQFNICRQNMEEVKCYDSDYCVNYSYYNYFIYILQIYISFLYQINHITNYLNNWHDTYQA